MNMFAYVCIVLTVWTLNRNYWMDHTKNKSEPTDQAANTVLKSPCCGCIAFAFVIPSGLFVASCLAVTHCPFVLRSCSEPESTSETEA